MDRTFERMMRETELNFMFNKLPDDITSPLRKVPLGINSNLDKLSVYIYVLTILVVLWENKKRIGILSSQERTNLLVRNYIIEVFNLLGKAWVEFMEKGEYLIGVQIVDGFMELKKFLKYACEIFEIESDLIEKEVESLVVLFKSHFKRNT